MAFQYVADLKALHHLGKLITNLWITLKYRAAGEGQWD